MLVISTNSRGSNGFFFVSQIKFLEAIVTRYDTERKEDGSCVIIFL
jgi:hypothetical protein